MTRPFRWERTQVLFAGPSEIADTRGRKRHWLTLAEDAGTIYEVKRRYAAMRHPWDDSLHSARSPQAPNDGRRRPPVLSTVVVG